MLQISLSVFKIAKTIKVLVVYCLLISTQCTANNFDFTPNLQKAYSEIFKLKIHSGRELLAKEAPNNPFKIYLEDYADMVELLNSENQKAYQKFLDKEDERLELIEESEKKSPYNRFLRAEIKLHWALIKIRFGHEIKASYNVIQAYRLLEENQQLFPNFLPNQKSLGCLHVLIGSVPENQKWISNLIGLRGNIQQGLQELQKASKDNIWGLEAKFCTIFIQAYVLKFDSKQNEEMLQLLENQPDNLNISLLLIAISLKDNRTEQAIELLKKSPQDSVYLYFPILELYKAETQLFKENYSQAIASYLTYLRNFKGKTFVKDTYYKLFICHWLLGDEKKGKLYLLKINGAGSIVAESDKAAQKFYENFIKNGVLPNKTLLKLRLLFDAGNFEEGKKELAKLSEKSFLNAVEQAEFNYRAGRIFQKLNQLEKAIGFFKRAITLTEENDWYFAPTSALQLGYIYQKNGDKEKAKRYFEKSLAYKRHEYKTSIDNKARAALTEMGY
ncbi:tetratricopeptide repeat protein [Emticicia aquatica]|uniref:tetratricopeptide repeat protein n=1 Tax=Emticicia aquatica TaxID=1681835 RepID=UPI001EEAECCD|nr:tetratricopeptide repeat protein [Emticicia aquatica]